MDNKAVSTTAHDPPYRVLPHDYGGGMTMTSPVADNPVPDLGDWLTVRPTAATEQEHVERIKEYQRLRGQLDAAMADEAVEFERKRVAAEAELKIPKAERGKGLAGEVALARGEAPAKGQQFLDLARALKRDLPHTRAAMVAGKIREEHAHSIAKATEVLSPKHRRKVDTALKNRLGVAGPKALAKEARAHAQSLDPKAAATRHGKAKDTRRVSCHSANDGMALLTAYGPAPAIQNMMNALEARAKSIMSSGKSRDTNDHKRSRDHVMFDLLAEWCTGHPNAMTASKVDLVVMMTPQTLLGQADTAAWLAGHGPIPADMAREWLADEQLKVMLRRLFSDNTATQLVGLESRGRSFPSGLRKMLLIRDDGCRSPFCEASIKEGDHINGVATGGKTTFANGSGLCGYCNQLKENRGWKHSADIQSLTVTTPTGHQYTKPAAPLLPGQAFETALPLPSDAKPPTSLSPPIRPSASPRRHRHRIAITQYLRC